MLRNLRGLSKEYDDKAMITDFDTVTVQIFNLRPVTPLGHDMTVPKNDKFFFS